MISRFLTYDLPFAYSRSNFATGLYFRAGIVDDISRQADSLSPESSGIRPGDALSADDTAVHVDIKTFAAVDMRVWQNVRAHVQRTDKESKRPHPKDAPSPAHCIK